ncbi:MAG: hypothetical protein ABSG97_02875 [Sedimentisphaerales bacterium]
MRNQNSPLSTVFRSAAQATDSTCIGCKANSAAMNALGQIAPVKLVKTKKTSRALVI